MINPTTFTPSEPPAYESALHDFRRARQQAALQEMIAHLTGKSTKLLSYDEVAEKLKLSGRSERGIQQIPLEAIVGSVGRYTDFTRTFLPLQDKDRQRWARVKAVATNPSEAGIPPIEVYKVGEVYFVLDGNHRVSIARQQGMAYIDALVIEVKTSVPLTPDVQPDDLILKAEYAEFLEQTCIADLIPGVDLSVTAPGQYRKLKEHIDMHRTYHGPDLQGELSQDEAVVSWYEHVYMPIASVIRERGLLRWFPHRTEADLYLWVSEHRDELEVQLGWEISPAAALTSLSVKEAPTAGKEERSTGTWRTSRMFDRYLDHLFKDILVPLSGREDDWNALGQALVVAKRENARVHGLHVAGSVEQARSPRRKEIEQRFLETCANAEVEGSFLVEVGNIVQKIHARALLTDLVILTAAHPPVPGLTGLRSRLRAVIRGTPRPTLVVKERVCSMDRVLLAYDGSPRSKEALFLATYLVEQWKAVLTVVTVLNKRRMQTSVQDYARLYLDLHEVNADFLVEKDSLGSLHKVIREREVNLLVMGSYNVSWLQEVTSGSLVNLVLREMKCPALMCR
jgi:nucleotide-binding universal stress UspA family protein